MSDNPEVRALIMGRLQASLLRPRPQPAPPPPPPRPAPAPAPRPRTASGRAWDRYAAGLRPLPSIRTLPARWREIAEEVAEAIGNDCRLPVVIHGGINCTDERLSVFADLVADILDRSDSPLLLQLNYKASYRASDQVHEIEAPAMIDWADLTREVS